MWKSSEPERSRRRISTPSHAIASWGEKDELLALLLARGSTRADAAKASGYSLRTVYARLANPAFKQMVADTRGRLIDETFGLLVAAGAGAIAVLKAMMDDAGQPGSTRLRAACEVLDSMLKVGTYAELSSRIAELERRADAQPGSQT